MKHGQDDWASWFERQAPALILFARQWTETHADAEDVVQNVFLRFWRGRGAATNALDPTAYVFASVKRAALDFRRSQLRRERREARVAREATNPEPVFESAAERDDWRARVEQVLRQLPESQREVVVLKIWGELTFPQIGEILQISHNTAASRYRHALETLRRRLAQETVS